MRPPGDTDLLHVRFLAADRGGGSTKSPPSDQAQVCVEGRIGVDGEPDGEPLRGLIAAVLDGHDEEDVLYPRLLFVARVGPSAGP